MRPEIGNSISKDNNQWKIIAKGQWQHGDVKSGLEMMTLMNEY